MRNHVVPWWKDHCSVVLLCHSITQHCAFTNRPTKGALRFDFCQAQFHSMGILILKMMQIWMGLRVDLRFQGGWNQGIESSCPTIFLIKICKLLSFVGSHPLLLLLSIRHALITWVDKFICKIQHQNKISAAVRLAEQILFHRAQIIAHRKLMV